MSLSPFKQEKNTTIFSSYSYSSSSASCSSSENEVVDSSDNKNQRKLNQTDSIDIIEIEK